MKSHRTHKPLLPSEEGPNLRKQLPKGAVSPKGKKQRLDEVKAAERDFWFWYEVREHDRAYEANCKYKSDGHKLRGRNGSVLGHCFHRSLEDTYYNTIKERYEKLWMQAKKDGVI